jgi:hypothetical protein
MSVIDVSISQLYRNVVIDQSGKEIVNIDTSRNSLFYLWDNYLSLGLVKSFVIVAMGDVCNLVMTLLSLRDDLEKSLKYTFLFPYETPMKPIPYSKSSWFYDVNEWFSFRLLLIFFFVSFFQNSMVFVPGEETQGTVLPFSRSLGKCIAAGLPDSLASRVSLPSTFKDLVFSKIKAVFNFK